MKAATSLTSTKNLYPKVRLILAIGIGGLVALCMPSSVDWEIRVLGSWSAGILSFLLQMGYMMIVASPKRTILYARLSSVNSASIFYLVVLTACISIFVVGVILTDSKDTPQPFRSIQIWLALVAIICSWLLTHIMFALHYAHAYYKVCDPLEQEKYRGGLQFPNEESPDYLDFLYFAFTVGMTSQTSDVAVTARPVRRLVLLHAIVSFFFYSVIFATTVNTVAGLV
jgi:uncharacterized membrane protein